MREYTEKEKTKILQEVNVVGNVSKVAQKYNISRQTIYNWRADRKDLDIGIALQENNDLIQKSSSSNFLDDIDKYKDLLKKSGTLEERKKKVSAKVEYMLIKVTTLLENHEDLDKIHPKDLSKIMKDLHDVRKELSNEPTIIIEYKNKVKEQVLQILSDFLDFEQMTEFAKRMEAVEADYEVL